jgi:hypothetical protein
MPAPATHQTRPADECLSAALALPFTPVRRQNGPQQFLQFQLHVSRWKIYGASNVSVAQKLSQSASGLAERSMWMV